MSVTRLFSFISRAAVVAAFITAAVDAAASSNQTQQFWQNTQARPLPAEAPQVSVYRPLLLDLGAIRQYLASARVGGVAFELAVPQPDGNFANFLVADSQTMPPALQAKYPEIVSLAGSDADGRKVRIDVSPAGFQAMVFDHDTVWVVRPETPGRGERYLSFRRADLAVAGNGFQCDVHNGSPDPAGHGLLSSPAPMTQTGQTQRVFRAAVAANHNYVNAVCSGNVTVACGLAAVVTAMNRVNQVYETEVAVHMTLIDDNDQIIYPTAATDPYTNDGNALDENIDNLNAVIGTANYDIGHVFTTGSGGVALLRSTCTSDKAGGTTGLSNPTGDAFYIDYVAHEMGHQFGGNHTFNSTASSCGGGNRAGSAAYEPGSGTTIMAYAGICGADNTQPHSDPYFHAKSLDEINTWLGSTGGSCAVAAANPDTAPVIDNASLTNGFTIPQHTAFALNGAASDVDGDTLSYNWEQYDLGPATTLAQGDTGAGPIFRSFNATASGTRIFPKLATVLGAALVKGETWPITTRNLNFRLTVRDNHNVPGTPQYGATQSANAQIHVTSDAGPFALTRPNTNLTWGRGETHLVSWDVAGTDVAPVSCSAVDIDLSVDGGQTWPDALASAVANSGSASVLVPNEPDTVQARVRVRCADNIFFDVSDVNFSIAATGDPDPTGPIAAVTPTSLNFEVAAGASTSDALTLNNNGDAASTLDYTITESADGCATETDVAWLVAVPANGSIAGGGVAGASVFVDAATLPAGVQTASLCVATNDPAHAQIVVPVTLTVDEVVDDIFKDGFDGNGAGTCEPAQLLQDSSFEATDSDGGSNPFWDSTTTQGDTVFWGEAGGALHIRTGSFVVWLGGYAADTLDPETHEASQAVVIPAGASRYFNYWRWIDGIGNGSNTVTFSVDGTTVATEDLAALGTDADWTQRSIDLSAYADGASHTIKFTYDHSGGATDADYYLDDATIDCTQPTAAAASPQLLPQPPRAAGIGKHRR